MKKCSVCGEFKDASEFFVRRIKKDGSVTLKNSCKACHSAGEMERYYRKQKFIDDRKTPCVKCGEKRLRCITFHHVNPAEKEFTLRQNRKSSLKVIEQEIAKCVCLCLNCHNEFHHLNNQFGTTLDEYLGN